MTSGYDKTTLKDAVQHRRTIYQLNDKSPIDEKRLKEIIELAVHDVPSSFNSQSTRLVTLVKDDHKKFWDIVRDILKAMVPADSWEGTNKRIQGFHNAFGTILFYEAPEPIKALQTKLPIYADYFPKWSEHTSAMHQYALWTALETEGFGANLQHYNPIADQKVAETWNVPLDWSLKAQLVFGGEVEGARGSLPEKTQEPIEKRFFFHGA